MNKDYVILARDPATERIAFATTKAFYGMDEATDYAASQLKDRDWMVVHSSFVKDIIENDMWHLLKDGDI